jgi:hypothetical protein
VIHRLAFLRHGNVTSTENAAICELDCLHPERWTASCALCVRGPYLILHTAAWQQIIDARLARAQLLPRSHALQLVLQHLVGDGNVKELAHVRLSCKKLCRLCDRLVISHTLALNREDAHWQLPIIKRFRNLRDLRVDLRKSCTEPQDLYAVLADVVRTVPQLQTLHVLCGLSDSDARLALPFTGAAHATA